MEHKKIRAAFVNAYHAMCEGMEKRRRETVAALRSRGTTEFTIEYNAVDEVQPDMIVEGGCRENGS